MATTLNKNRKNTKPPKGMKVFKKMLKDKKFITKHLENGGSFKELKEKGYHFATV